MTGGGRGVEGKGKKKGCEGEARGEQGEGGEQAHLYVWLPVCKVLRHPRFD